MYFEKCGNVNTKEAVKLAVKTAKDRGINYIVVASNEGETAKVLKDCGINIVVVTHANGYKEAGTQEMSYKTRTELESYGFKVYTSSHALSGAERSLSKKFGGISPIEVMAYSLRMFGQGIKVCVEISTMALDGGMIPYDEDIISIGGTGRGADSAIILRPAHSSDILQTKIKEIICKPAQW
ncbi:MAG TPA: pyruvate kinase alpha/beta domain-containing protein [Clostridium sp.]|uniref:pyruvate kinase alpha/beta domain-containing protein n=1 Tax=Clostridium sp. TaxID=1506 RepID=UPI002F9211C8